LIDFEDLSKFESYTSTILVNIIDTIFKEFNIRKNLISITRDNASAINSTIDLIRNRYNVSHGRAAYTGEPPTFTKPLLKYLLPINVAITTISTALKQTLDIAYSISY
jgi:hypothetical protein